MIVKPATNGARRRVYLEELSYHMFHRGMYGPPRLVKCKWWQIPGRLIRRVPLSWLEYPAESYSFEGLAKWIPVTSDNTGPVFGSLEEDHEGAP